MKPEVIKKFLAALGQHKPMDGAVWITCACPLAPFTHKKGTDTKPSFGISMETGHFNCFTCQQGTLPKLLQTLEMHLAQQPHLADKYQVALARQILEEHQDLDPLPDYEEQKLNEKIFEPWPDWWLEQYVPIAGSARGRWYLEFGRKLADEKNQVIPLEVATKFGLAYDSHKDMIVCPYRNFGGKLAGARGRAVTQEAKLRHYDYTWNGYNNAQLAWFNEPVLEDAAKKHKPVVVVEGQFDCMNVARVYPWVVAGLTAKSSKKKIEKLEACEGVIVMLDNDETGRASWKRYVDLLQGKVPLGRLDLPEGFKDPAQLDPTTLADMFGDLL